MSEYISVDEIDEQLIEILRADGRSSNQAIARALKVTATTVSKRLKRLEAAGVVTFGLVVDVRATGMRVSGYLSVQTTAETSQGVADVVANLDACAMCCLSTGQWNIRAFIYGANSDALRILIEDILLLPGVISATFQEATGHAQHRYELIMPGCAITNRWGS